MPRRVPPGVIRIGISGYDYPAWRGRFYPAELARPQWLQYASREFDTIELNATFYRLQSPRAFERWAAETPPDCVLAVKGSRFITHQLKLRGIEAALANFYASGVLLLGRKTGPFLWQLPPTYRYAPDRVAHFLALLPAGSADAEALARGHTGRLREAALQSPDPVAYRHAVEVRHASYLTEDFFGLLRTHGCALVIADTAGRYPSAHVLTADFTYVRLHGSAALYASRYTDAELAEWGARLTAWAAGGRDVYVYFDNDAFAHAPHDAQRLRRVIAELSDPAGAPRSTPPSG